MAAIDKIYGSYDQYKQLRIFLIRHKPEYLDFLYEAPHRDSIDAPLCNFSSEADQWLMKNCTLGFIQERLKFQYSEQNEEDQTL